MLLVRARKDLSFASVRTTFDYIYISGGVGDAAAAYIIFRYSIIYNARRGY